MNLKNRVICIVGLASAVTANCQAVGETRYSGNDLPDPPVTGGTGLSSTIAVSQPAEIASASSPALWILPQSSHRFSIGF